MRQAWRANMAKLKISKSLNPIPLIYLGWINFS
jgi:hypothetical protein